MKYERIKSKSKLMQLQNNHLRKQILNKLLQSQKSQSKSHKPKYLKRMTKKRINKVCSQKRKRRK